MPLDQATVARVAKLARIEMSEEELAGYADELSGILAWIERLNEVDTDSVEPLRSVVAMKPTLRDDAVTDGERADDVLANAPARQDAYYVVPKVVE